MITELKHDNSAVKVSIVQPRRSTVQFDWNDSEFEQHPMPVAPIFQPELPARAVRYLADHPRRNMWVGASTAATILEQARTLVAGLVPRQERRERPTHHQGRSAIRVQRVRT